MIRFCDNEVCCVWYEELDRSSILNYFFQDHMNEIVCIVDSEGKYKGKISYYSLINTDNIFEAVQKECVVLDQKVWQNARYYFSHYKSNLNEHVLLPVVDQTRQLLCFAYEDYDANREIRMLRELSENIHAMQFPDIYPEYQCVKIYEFNELAYFFAKYLESQNIEVQVYGQLWNGLFEGTVYQGLDYECMNIYAEGLGCKKADWVENLLKSVSVEFECIDIIYETNIKNGIFRDAEGSCSGLLNRLKSEKEIIVLGTGREAQDVYDFLTGNNIDICCFVNENYGERSHRLFGKEILGNIDARNKYKNPVFIECLDEHSAWGFGGTDYYDYIGFKRNESFFLIKDYVDMVQTNLENILKKKRIVLLGDINLCAYLYDFFRRKKFSIMGYLNYERQSDNQRRLPEVYPKEINKDTICLFAVQDFLLIEGEKKRQLAAMAVYLKENGLDNYTDYFSYMDSFVNMEVYNKDKYTKNIFIPKRIILGSIEGNSGNAFFGGLLDNHPSILMMNHCSLNDCLFRYCICLSKEESKKVLPAFWQMYKNESENVEIFDPKAFNDKMEQLLGLSNKFSSQELFIIFHIAFMYTKGRDILVSDIKNMVIYWEPHHVERKSLENCAKWLGDKNVNCDIINVVRNIVMRNGDVKRVLRQYNDERRAFATALNYPSIEKKDYQWCNRLVVKFEDIKSNPRKTLAEICEQWGISWSDTLMTTTRNGEKALYNNGEYLISDFDLKSVYNTNEKYFSEFDRFRIMLINAPWQRKYGYPYVKIMQFTRRELQEMFFKRFRFEDMINYHNMKLEREFKIGLYNFIRNKLQKVRMIELINDNV